jgi:hypothetical protein
MVVGIRCWFGCGRLCLLGVRWFCALGARIRFFLGRSGIWGIVIGIGRGMRDRSIGLRGIVLRVGIGRRRVGGVGGCRCWCD